MIQLIRPTAPRGRAVLAATLLCWSSNLRGASAQDSLASHFTTAPDTASDQQQLVQVEVNGLAAGDQIIRVSQGLVTLPAASVQALGIVGKPDASLVLSPASGIAVRFEEAQGKLSLGVPVSRLAKRRFAPDVDNTRARLSPESWGAYVNYDMSLRHTFGTSASTSVTTGTATAVQSSSSASPVAVLSGLAELRVLAPDFIGGFGWAYDGSSTQSEPLVRLDSTATWRPAWLDLTISAGDIVSSTSPLTQARAYRFVGTQIGTDFSGTPGWSSSPIASVAGTAQAQSAIDVYLDGQRTFHTDTAGGAFSLVLPPGSNGAGTNVVITDVTGHSTVIPIEVQRVDARLLRQGVFLWSAGVGAPRFGYGSSTTSYDRHLFANANARYGAWRNATVTMHAEGGPGLAEAEGGADIAVVSRLAVHAAVAASESTSGPAGAGYLGFALAGPWNLSLEGNITRTFGPFDDVVSVSGRAYDHASGIDPVFSQAATSQMSARLAWQATYRLSLSASYEAETYAGSKPVGFASLGASTVVDGIPVFANLSDNIGGQPSTTIVVGVSISFGSIQTSASGGYGSANQNGNGQGGYTGGLTASRPLGDAVGDVGWDGYGTRGPTGTFVNADAQARTGSGVAGVAVQSFGSQVTTYATLRGAAGVIGLHPFVSDPATGGIIIADAGQPGVPVQLNGYDKGYTAFDGRMAIAGAVAGVPQRVTIDTERLPIDAIPTETDQIVVVRDEGAAVASFGVHSAAASATMQIMFHGQPPPVGSTLVSATSSAPISKEGRAYLPTLNRNEVLTVEMPDGTKCRVRTRFDGRGGVGRRLGTFVCEEAR